MPRDLPDHLTANHRAFWERSELVLAPDDPVPGAWVGAPTAVHDDGTWWLAYRVRRPLGEGRGVANVIARSDDGVAFTPVVTVGKGMFGAESVERPAMVRSPTGGWLLYVSCATPGTKHWRVDVLAADSVEALAHASPRTVLPGSDREGIKDPVIRWVNGRFHLWASVHPLDDPDATDRMTTEYYTSSDGFEWTWAATALRGNADAWDERGVRLSSVLLLDEEVWATYDGPANAVENWEERTGLAHASSISGPFTSRTRDAPLLAGPHGPGGLRYADAVPLGDGTFRWFFEITREDGAHELRTVVL